MESEFHLGEYIAILKRRYIYLVLPFLVVLGGSVAVAVLLPPVFQSSGTILIESPQIPEEMISSTVTGPASERIQVIQQRVMTRANLFRIAEKFDVFKDDDKIQSTTEAVEKMREMANVEFLYSDGGKKRRRGNVTIAFKVSFEHRRPEVAVRAANELVTLFLDQNVKTRTARASETSDFLSREADKLEKSLQEIEDKIANYKQKNVSALPEHLDLRLKMRDRSEAEYQELDREIKALQEEKRFLEIEIAGLKAGYRINRTIFEAPQQEKNGNLLLAKQQEEPSEREIAEQQLKELESKLSEAKQRYSDTHPDVRRLIVAVVEARNRFKTLPEDPKPKKTPVEITASEPSATVTTDPIMATVLAKIASADARIDSMKVQKTKLKAKIDEIETMIIQTPQVERGLSVLVRNQANAKQRYEEVRAKQMQSELSKNLEEDRKAERFILVEPPVMPEEPIRPNRQKMLAIGFALSLAAGGGGIFLVEMIDGSIRGVASLAAVTKLQPLASIPYIVTTREARRRKRVKVLVLLALLLIFVAALAAVHFLYMPLDIAFYKVMARF